jgi:hypothetical protein
VLPEAIERTRIAQVTSTRPRAFRAMTHARAADRDTGEFVTRTVSQASRPNTLERFTA